MAEKFYHKELKKAIQTIAKESKKYKRVEVEKKIPIPHPNQEMIFHYKPEVILTTKSGKKYIFELLDDQLKDYNLIVSDIIQSFLIGNVAKVIFISKNREGDELTNKLSKIIGARLEYNGFFKREIPEVLIYTISYREVKSPSIIKILKSYAQKDAWD